MLKEGTDSQQVAKEHGNRYGVQDRLVYGAALKGYAGKIPPGQLAKIQSDPRVAYVEPDGVVHKSATTQASPPWGLDRIDQGALPLSGSYTYTSDGTGVKAYVIDTGIRRTHAQFGGRAIAGADYVSPSTGSNDCDGHGTHVAGTIGGATYGVAKNVTLVAVRVLDCGGSGYWSWVIAGIDWVTAQREAYPAQPAVANMSLGGGATSSVDSAVSRSITKGVTYSIAAGNSNRDACRYTPARVGDALTIGSTTSTDARSSFSNYGSCVDWFAPGSSILSAYHTSDTATATMSGTSMAAPHVAGAAALYLQGDTDATPAEVRGAVFNDLTKGVVTNSNTANNHLLFVGGLGPVMPDDTTAPAAPTALDATAGDAQVSLDWTNNGESDLAGYNVYRSTSSGSNYEKLNGTLVTSSAYVDAGAVNGTTYYYVVKAVDTSTNESAASNEDSATPEAAITPPPSGDLTLDATGYKVKGLQKANLSWSGAGEVDVYWDRSTAKLATVSGSQWVHDINAKGGGSYTYTVCVAGTTTCSSDTVVF